MSSAVHIADDVALFILENEGVFFSQTTQELHRFNTTATYLWCCIEEQRSPAEITAAYADAFGVGADEAARCVADTLHRWQGQGYLSGVDVRSPTEIDLTTALGRLLTNPRLRAAFAHSPAGLARQLRLRDADLESFLALDPRELEAQAQTLAGKRLARAKRASATAADTTPAVAPRVLPVPGHAIDRCYHLPHVTFRVRFSSPAQERWVHPMLAHLETDVAAGPADALLEILEDGEELAVRENGREVARCSHLDEVAARIHFRVRCMAIDHQRYLLHVHAGAVCDGERCILLPAAPRGGKSTLTAALIGSGFRYCSDEVALLEEQSLQLWPVPVSLAIKPGSLDVLSAYYPELRHLPLHVREDGDMVRYLNPSRDALVRDPCRSYPVAVIVFPRYAPGETTALRPLSRPAALDRLLQHSLVSPAQLDHQTVGNLVRWMRTVQSFEMPMASLPAAVELVQGLR